MGSSKIQTHSKETIVSQVSLKLSSKQIIAVVGDVFRVAGDNIVGRDDVTNEAIEARCVAAWFIRHHVVLTYTATGQELGGRTAEEIGENCKRAIQLTIKDPHFKEKVKEIRIRLGILPQAKSARQA